METTLVTVKEQRDYQMDEYVPFEEVKVSSPSVNFLEANTIIFLTERYVTIRNSSNDNEVKKLKVELSLADEHPVKVTFLSKKQIFD